MLDHITARLIAGAGTVLCLASLLGTTGFRNAELESAAKAKTIANQRIVLPEAKISAGPILLGEPAVILGADGVTPVPAPAGVPVFSAEGITAKTKATSNGLGRTTITYQDVYAGSQDTAAAQVKLRLERTKELLKQ
jgi:hypothetical protein